MTSTMTRKQRNALKTIPGVTITSGREVEIFIDNGEGRADDDATEAVLVKVAALIGWGAYRSGYALSYCLISADEQRGRQRP